MYEMKNILVFSLLLVAFAFSIRLEYEYQYEFSKYIVDFHKEYTPLDFKTRYNQFKKNIDLIDSHNAEFTADFFSNFQLSEELTLIGKHTFWLGLNQFADLSNEEYQRLNSLHTRPSFKPISYYSPSGIAAPDTWDWRDKSAVTRVKNQGQCGSCWSFSATAALESAWYEKSGSLIEFSEQFCVDCANEGKDNCLTGGFMEDCYKEVIKRGGEQKEVDYPYQATSGHPCRFNDSKKLAPFKSFETIKEGDEDGMKEASSQHVLSVAIDASSYWFQLYSGADCKKKMEDLDHGVTVVGYNHDWLGGDYWIVKNSWGAGWGLKGYIWMSRNKDNQCGIATIAQYPIPQ